MKKILFYLAMAGLAACSSDQDDSAGAAVNNSILVGGEEAPSDAEQT